MTTTADICIPWRAQPDRIPAHERVIDFWKHHRFNPIEGDSDGRRKAFSICEARNRAVRQSKADVVVLSDADTIPDIARVLEAIESVGSDEVIYPFTYYRHIPGEYVNSSDLHAAPIDKEYRGSVGGTMVIRRDTYWAWGGMDERFEPRWGYDDSAFQLVAKTLGKVTRMPGVIYSFNHAADRDMSVENPNRWRFDLYKLCVNKPQLMRELIK
ncbi:galactosyl transferase [Gordonia phage Neville]|uniref:Glycosyltransferase n=1 Tax=Gordonia phage Neville TaxID=2301693 RepID=A0A385E0D7_9CAUD|nr:galactosyl transferase [Gordonia phage Neville]AXQ64478.1 glycosyltransferase [Gordonia phage Neville]